MSLLTMTNEKIREHGASLGRRMIHKAHRVAQDIGFGYRPVPYSQAPSNLGQLLLCFQHSRQYSVALPVLREFCDNTIYGSAEANYAYRYLHDLVHVITGEEMEPEGEYRVHTRLAQILGIKSSLADMGPEDILYWVDSAGQTMLEEVAGTFPERQDEFAIAVSRWWTHTGHLRGAVERYSREVYPRREAA